MLYLIIFNNSIPHAMASSYITTNVLSRSWKTSLFRAFLRQGKNDLHNHRHHHHYYHYGNKSCRIFHSYFIFCYNTLFYVWTGMNKIKIYLCGISWSGIFSRLWSLYGQYISFLWMEYLSLSLSPLINKSWWKKGENSNESVNFIISFILLQKHKHIIIIIIKKSETQIKTGN